MTLKRWNGNRWELSTLNRFDGTSWFPANLKRWNGTTWVPANNFGWKKIAERSNRLLAGIVGGSSVQGGISAFGDSIVLPALPTGSLSPGGTSGQKLNTYSLTNEAWTQENLGNISHTIRNVAHDPSGELYLFSRNSYGRKVNGTWTFTATTGTSIVGDVVFDSPTSFLYVPVAAGFKTQIYRYDMTSKTNTVFRNDTPFLGHGIALVDSKIVISDGQNRVAILNNDSWTIKTVTEISRSAGERLNELTELAPRFVLGSGIIRDGRAIWMYFGDITQ